MSASLARDPVRLALLSTVLCAAAAIVGWALLFWPECQAAIRVWIDSTAYGHCFLVIPIAIYLGWERLPSLHGLRPQADYRFAVLAVPLPFAWFVAERLGIMEGRQLIAVTAFEVLALTILGWTLFRAVLGPMLYLFFLVPFGAFLTPALQSFTAGFTDVGLTILGIPHYVTDLTIEISAGTFYVAEACAGLRFLIASIAFGVFFALLNYSSTRRRTIFILASIAIPIVANGFRALGIVSLGNILGSAEAAAADHIIYGWVFFSFVMLLLVAVGLPFREPLPPAPTLTATHVAAAQPWAVAIALALVAIGPASAYAFNRLASQGQLAANPAYVAPAGCTIQPSTRPTPDVALAAMQCGPVAWTVTLRSLPARATAAALSGARQVMLGALNSDEAVTGNLDGAPGWRSIVSHDPSEVMGYATWVDGRKAGGGLAQRLLQARESVFGASHSPAILGLVASGGNDTSQTRLREMVATLTAFVAAQPDLDAQIAKLTEVH